jgi:hypothetical protein
MDLEFAPCKKEKQAKIGITLNKWASVIKIV